MATFDNSTGIILGTVTASAGAPVTQHLTTAAIWVYSLSLMSTAGTAGNAAGVYSATSALSTQSPRIRMTNPTAITLAQFIYPNGVYFGSGLQFNIALTFGTTGTNTAGASLTVEYRS